MCLAVGFVGAAAGAGIPGGRVGIGFPWQSERRLGHGEWEQPGQLALI